MSIAAVRRPGLGADETSNLSRTRLLQLIGPHTTSHIESYLTELAETPAERPVVPCLPSRLKDDDLSGAGGALLQVLMARRTTAGVLRTYVSPSGA